MITIENVQERVASSSYNINIILHPDHIKCYFDFLVNQSKTIDILDYKLHIVDDRTNHSIISYNQENRMFIFNIREFFINYLREKNIGYIADAYDFNFNLIHYINKIVAELEIYRMAQNKLLSSIEPIFFTNIIEELVGNHTNKELINNYIKFRSLQLTDNFIRNVSQNYTLDNFKDLSHFKSFNDVMLDYYNETDKYYMPIFISIDSKGKNESEDIQNKIKNIFGEKIGKNVYDNYLNAKEKYKYTDSTNLLNALLLGKPINKKQYPNLNELTNKMSLFEYAENQNEASKNEIINKLK